jgi:hypothetical protein
MIELKTVEEIKNRDPFILFLPSNRTGIKGYFENARVNKDNLPNGWYAYDLREGDNGEICSIEYNVIVNHFGTFLTQTPINLEPNGYIVFGNDSKADYSFS